MDDKKLESEYEEEMYQYNVASILAEYIGLRPL